MLIVFVIKPARRKRFFADPYNMASKSLIPLLLALLVVVTVAEAINNYYGYKVITVQAKTDEQVKAIRELEKLENVNFWKEPNIHTTTDICVPPRHINRVKLTLMSLGLEPKITVENVQLLIFEAIAANSVARFEASSFRSGVSKQARVKKYFLRLVEIDAWMKQLAAENPSLIKVWSIGQSHEGRHTLAMRIGDGTKPGIFIDAGIHAREWLAVSTALYLINELVDGLKTGKTTDLLAKYDWYFVPVVNPDGYEYTHTNKRMWRKNRRPMSYCVGADPNRNFDINFGGAGTSSQSCQDTYHGTSAFSEPCARNLAVLLMGLSQKNRLVAYMSLHAYAQMWFTPFAYSRWARPDDIDELTRVAKIGARAIYNTNGKSYTVGSPANILYEAAGSSMDWVKAKTNIKYAFAMEMRPSMGSRNGFIVPPSEIVPAGEEMFAGITAMAAAMRR
ncbi:carboxypeptidase B-like [Tubulanus polymorphus]|uniref:carboxypeptidase B-like n=1 Tax=Tubulanus polymorphus TaxID=672921 RepID=UPI003DA67473